MIKLSIIITHHKTLELLDLCIKSIKETAGILKYEIIVVDSEAEKNSQETIKEKHPEIKFIPFKKNLGYSKIVNTGIKETKGEYILILNADIIILENAISELVEFMDKNHKCGIAGPQLLDFAGNIQPSCFKNPIPTAIVARRTLLGRTGYGKKALEKFYMEKSDSESAKEVDWIQGSAMMIRRGAMEKVGLFDERFFMYFEDADLCRRFWQSGWKVIYLPKAKMAHYYHRSSKKWGGLMDMILNKYTRIHIVSAIKYFLKYRKTK